MEPGDWGGGEGMGLGSRGWLGKERLGSVFFSQGLVAFVSVGCGAQVFCSWGNLFLEAAAGWPSGELCVMQTRLLETGLVAWRPTFQGLCQKGLGPGSHFLNDMGSRWAYQIKKKKMPS